MSTSFDQRLRDTLSANGARLLEIKPLHGGACQDTFRVDVELDSAPVRLALRSDAVRSLPFSLRRDAEFAVVTAAVAAGVTTPKARWLTPDLVREGAFAYFLDWVDGEALGRRVLREKSLAAAREALPATLAAQLARLHAVTPASAATLPLTTTSEGPEGRAIAQLRQMLDELPSPAPAVELGLSWLAAHLPSPSPWVLVHGDFRVGNFMVTPEGLAGVLDWEFAHFGSAYEDLTWISVRDWRFGRVDQPLGGFAQRAPFYDAYASATGRPIEAERVLWWEVAGNLRWAVGSLFQGERYLAGGEQDLELIAIARRSVEMEFEALRLIRAGRV